MLLKEKTGKVGGQSSSSNFVGFSSIEMIVKASDETVNNSTTLQDDDELVVSVASNETIYFEMHVIVNSNTTADWKMAFTVPSGATLSWNGISGIIINTNGSPAGNADIEAGGTSDFQGGAGANQVHTIIGHVINSTTAGNLQLQWAQNTLDASDTIVRAQSRLMVWRV